MKKLPETKSRTSVISLICQSTFCLMTVFNSCNIKEDKQISMTWSCDEKLPDKFKLVFSSNSKKYAIQSGMAWEWGYENGKEVKKYTYYYLGGREDRIIVVDLGDEKQFDDSCSAKLFCAKYLAAKKYFEETLKEKFKKDSIEKMNHIYK